MDAQRGSMNVSERKVVVKARARAADFFEGAYSPIEIDGSSSPPRRAPRSGRFTPYPRDSDSSTPATSPYPRSEPCRHTPPTSPTYRELDTRETLLIKLRDEAAMQKKFCMQYYQQRIDVYSDQIREIQGQMAERRGYVE
ncbi:hypothetical protein ScPMuIL_015172 [Solemya velum]